MIKYVKGDAVKALKNGEINYLIHCCNAQGVMGSGIAKQIKEEIPQAFDVYKNYCNRFSNTEDLMGAVPFGGGVFNLIGQEYYGTTKKRYVNYGAVAKGFSQIFEDVEFILGKLIQSRLYDGNVVLGLPYKFGCDRAGGDWEIMEELIESLLCCDFKVKVYEL